MTENEILDLLFKAQEMSYSPYSNFRVGAVCVMNDGKILFGANIENAAYGDCICAERSLLVQFKMNRYKPANIKHFALIGDSNDVVTPCGSCRQVLLEILGKNVEILMFNKDGSKSLKLSVDQLIPYGFSGESLDK